MQSPRELHRIAGGRLFGALVVLALSGLLAPSCTTPELGGSMFVCTKDADCGDGWRCHGVTADHQGLCVPADATDIVLPDGWGPGDVTDGDTAQADAGVQDAVADGADAVTDAGLPDAATDTGVPDQVSPPDTTGVPDQVTPPDAADAADSADVLDVADGADVPDVADGVVLDVADAVDVLDTAGPADAADAADADITETTGQDTTDTADAGPCCPLDELPCLLNECLEDGGCPYEPAAGTCLIDGKCYFDDEDNGACGVCNSSISQLNWSQGGAGPCDDGSACTTEGCNGLACTHVVDDCDDGNSCTTDHCDDATGLCSHVAKDCDDGDPCTEDACTGGVCSNVQVACDDGDPCTTDVCEGGSCLHAPKDCDDGDSCTVDTCVGGVCSSGPLTCDDANTCTADSCSPATGCVFAAVPCDDGDPCTTDSCDPASGCGVAPTICNDGDPCTLDTCNPATGCQFAAIACDDGVACTLDTCGAGGCEYLPDHDACNDGSECRMPLCDPSVGCLSLPWFGDCDDGSACTAGETCQTGECLPPELAPQLSEPQYVVATPDESSGDANASLTSHAGEIVLVWNTNASYDNSGSDSDVLIATLASGASSFSAPTVAWSGMRTDDATDANPTVASDRHGGLVVAWELQGTNDFGLGWDKDVVAMVRTNGTWSAPAPVATHELADSTYDTLPVAAATGTGSYVVAWSSQYPGAQSDYGPDPDVFVARRAPGQGWVSGPLHVADAKSDGERVDSLSNQSLASDGHDTLVLAWAASDSVDSTYGSDGEVVFSRSADGGVTWSAPAFVVSTAATDAAIDTNVAVGTDGAGQWAMAWQSERGSGTNMDDDILFVRSTDDGVTWSSPVTLNTGADTDTTDEKNPWITVVDGGRILVGWDTEMTSSGTVDTYIALTVSDDAGATFSPPVLLADDAAFDAQPDVMVALAARGANVVAVWSSTVSQDENDSFNLLWGSFPLPGHPCDDGDPSTLDACLVSACTSTPIPDYCDDGLACTTDSKGPGGCTNEPHDELCDDDNECTIDQCGATSGCSSTPFSGACTPANPCMAKSAGCVGGTCISSLVDPTFTNLTAMPGSSGTGGDDRRPRIATNGAGDWVAVWESTEPSGTDVRVVASRSVDDGASWTAPILISPEDALSLPAPSVANDGAGTWITAWATMDPKSLTSSIAWARSLDNGATWSAPTELNQTGGKWNEGAPLVASPEPGRFVITFSSTKSATGLGSDLDVMIATSTDAGQTFSAPEPLSDTASTDGALDDDTSHGALTSDGDGNLVVLWKRWDAAASEAVLMTSRSSDSGGKWTTPTPLDPVNAALNSGPNEESPSLATNGRGLWIAAFVRIMPVTSDRQVFWSSSVNDGKTWSAPRGTHKNGDSDGGADFDPTVTTDGAGLWLLAWDSTASAKYASGYGSDRDLFYMHSGDDGDTWFGPSPLNGSYGTSDTGDDEGLALHASRTGRFMGLYRGEGPGVTGVGPDGDLVLVRGKMAYPCVDGKPDTVDVCRPPTGCTALTHEELCDDGDLCTVDKWNAGSGCTYEAIQGCSD